MSEQWQGLRNPKRHRVYGEYTFALCDWCLEDGGGYCSDNTPCRCCFVARIAELEAENKALRDRIEAARIACNFSTEVITWQPPRGERGIHFPVVRVDRILAALDGDA